MIWHQENPDDAFILYALATEYRQESPDKALAFFDKLLAEHPDETATYYHAAELYADRDDFEKAKEIYEKGLLVCQQENDLHALRELQNAYNNFLILS